MFETKIVGDGPTQQGVSHSAISIQHNLLEEKSNFVLDNS